MLTKVLTALLIAVTSTLVFFYFQLEVLESKIETKDTIIKTAKSSLQTAKNVNSDLSSTIKSLSDDLELERKAVEHIKKYNETVDEAVKAAVNDLKGLLQNDENSCGQQRLPDAVIDSMQQHYDRLRSSDADS